MRFTDTKLHIAQDLRSIFDENELYNLKKCNDMELDEVRRIVLKFMDDCRDITGSKNFDSKDPFQNLLDAFGQRFENEIGPECEEIIKKLDMI